MNTMDLIEDFNQRLAEIANLGAIAAVLDWDQNCYMPEAAALGRAAQAELMSTLSHQRLTDPRFWEITQELRVRDTLSEADRVNVRETTRVLERQRKLPAKFVAEQARERAICFDIWSKAKPRDRFDEVASHLEKMIDLIRREANFVGYQEHPYDAMLDLYEPGTRLSLIKPVLSELGDALAPRVARWRGKPKGASIEGCTFPKAAQEELGKRLWQKLGLEPASARLDVSPHPFSTRLGPADFRITTRYSEADFASSMYGTLHETGHSLYEQGLPREQFGRPSGQASSTGIHESQSRFVENMLGRSREFIQFAYPMVIELFPCIKHWSEDDLWAHVNHIEPSLKRVEADEVTYSLHLVIRLLLEEQLITGSLKIRELPEAWDSLYQKYLGIKCDKISEGVMQDVHWYSGLFGYFPTYVLGNVYGGCLLEALNEDEPNWLSQAATGNFTPAVQWMKTRVHSEGMKLQPTELVKKASRRAVTSAPFLKYLDGKFGHLG